MHLIPNSPENLILFYSSSRKHYDEVPQILYMSFFSCAFTSNFLIFIHFPKKHYIPA